MMTFSISDGAVPNNVGRGYVVRRVLRRGARFAHKYFNTEIGTFFSKLVPTIVQQMGDAFPEIKKNASDVCALLDEEEKSFARSLDRGETIFEKYAQKCKVEDRKRLPGTDVWRLYDTYGFPVDLTKIMAEERGLEIDDKEVQEAQEKAREASKGAKKAGAALVKLTVHDIAALEMKKLPKTDDNAKYGRDDIMANIKAIFYPEKEEKFLSSTSDIPEGSQFGLILDKTCFYAEQGGQEYDTGKILIDEKAEMDVQNVQVYAGYVLHTGYMKYGHLSLEDQVTCEYDTLRRAPIEKNHTGTHILNFALREVLGDGVDQKGSLVAPEKLRFDFSNNAAVTEDQLRTIEEKSCGYIDQNALVYATDVPIKTAQNIEGVRAVFGETYPDPVRVVSIGMPVDELVQDVKSKDWRNFSIEFCGGTHVSSTGEIKKLVVLTEEGIAKGIRRIVAVTGQDAFEVDRVAAEFQEKLNSLERMPYSVEKEKRAKELNFELGQLTISALVKIQMRKQHERILGSIKEGHKLAAKQNYQRVLSPVTEFFSKEENQEKRFLVIRVPYFPNGKAINDVVKNVSSGKGKEGALKSKSLYLLAGDEEDGRVMHACYVAEVRASLKSSI
jgi:alanyl-tRNA synthetase